MLTARGGMSTLSKILIYTILTLVAVTMAAPFLYMLSTALKAPHEITTIPPVWIPERLMWENFVKVWTILPFGRYVLNTIFVTVCITVGTVVTSSLGAYAFSRLEWPGRDTLFMGYLGTMMVPFSIIMIPLYQMMKHLEWIDTYKALIIPWLFSAYGTFLLRQFFMGIPKELEEAAIIDGAGRLGILTRIIMPLSKPALITLGTFTFLSSWNSFLWPLIVTNSQTKYVLTIGLNFLQGTYFTQVNLVMAAVTITVLPTILLFLFGQRYFIESVAITGMKG